MSRIVDSHVHVFPNPAAGLSGAHEVRRRARAALSPLTRALHKIQPYTRHVPSAIRAGLDQVGSAVMLPGMLLEATPEDLTEEMKRNDVWKAVVIAHPPFVPNEFVLDLAERDPAIVPAVLIPTTSYRPGVRLRSYVRRGARALKIHPPADGHGPDSEHYRKLLRSASALGVPVIIHTGCLHVPLVYRSPEQGHAERYEPWFREYPDTKFVLAHMNFHFPQVALDLMERHRNVYADTSWQPAEVIGEAVRRVGAERILLGSDWPILGGNISVALARIGEAVETGRITSADRDLIVGANAAGIFGLE